MVSAEKEEKRKKEKEKEKEKVEKLRIPKPEKTPKAEKMPKPEKTPKFEAKEEKSTAEKPEKPLMVKLKLNGSSVGLKRKKDDKEDLESAKKPKLCVPLKTDSINFFFKEKGKGKTIGQNSDS